MSVRPKLLQFVTNSPPSNARGRAGGPLGSIEFCRRQRLMLVRPVRLEPERAHRTCTGAIVQTTLLSIAIALIVALLAALLGPHVIRWNDHRAFFEAEASRLVGIKVRVGGDIDAALLPTPVGDAARHRHRPGRRGQPAARPLASHRTRARAADARRASGHRDEARRPAVQHRPRRQWPDRLAAAHSRQRDAVDRPSADRRRPRDADRRGQQVEAGARSVVVHRRRSLAHRSDPGQGRVRHRRRTLRLRDFGRTSRS